MKREDMGRVAKVFGLRIADGHRGPVVLSDDGCILFSCDTEDRLGAWLADHIIKTCAPPSVARLRLQKKALDDAPGAARAAPGRTVLGKDLTGIPIRAGDRIMDVTSTFKMTVTRVTTHYFMDEAGYTVPLNRAAWLPSEEDIATAVAKALDDEGVFKPLEPAI